MTRPLLLSALLLAACRGADRSPFLRIVHNSGRIYYAHVDRTLYSDGGGFLTFRDLVTRESVKLKNGTYKALECPASEVDIRQREYLENPRRLPGEGEVVPPR
ncbi:MAG: hypothetical protein ACREID_07640 [Planctomycetota bacterium]